MLWHRLVLRHTQTRTRVTAPLWDISALGILIRCSCGKVWAK